MNETNRGRRPAGPLGPELKNLSLHEHAAWVLRQLGTRLVLKLDGPDKRLVMGWLIRLSTCNRCGRFGNVPQQDRSKPPHTVTCRDCAEDSEP